MDTLRSTRNRWVAPAAAAAAVAIVVGVSAAIAGRPGQSMAADLGPGTAFPLRAAPAVDGGAVPAYEVANGNDRRSVQVLATATGAVLATVRISPRSAGDLSVEAGAADDRTFVLGHASRSHARLYLLRLNPQAATARLYALPITLATSPALQVAGLALSPDGSRLAIAENNWAPVHGGGSRIWVYDLAAGTRREWLWPGPGLMSSRTAKGQASLSWAADNKTVAFEMQPGSAGLLTEVRLLDTEAPGADLSKSRVVVKSYQRSDGSLVSVQSPLITPDGTKIVLGRYQAAALQHGSLPETFGIEEYSAETGRLVGKLYQQHYVVPAAQSGNPGLPPMILWANSSATVLIASTSAAVAEESGQVGVLRDGRFTVLQDQGNPDSGTGTW